MLYYFGESVPESQTNLVLSTRYFVREVKRLIRSVSSQRLLPAKSGTSSNEIRRAKAAIEGGEHAEWPRLVRPFGDR